MHVRSGPAIAVSDCRSIAIDRVHRLGGFLLVSLIDNAPGLPSHRFAPELVNPGMFDQG